VPTAEALARAQEVGLDLVEVAPTVRPPVCRILDYGKYKYEISKKDKSARKKQHNYQLKEMRYRPRIDDHDFDFKTRHVREFLLSGNKVKAFCMFRGREMAYTEFGQEVLERVVKTLSDVANVEQMPKLDGRTMTLLLAPKPEVLKKVKDMKPAEPQAHEKKQEASKEPKVISAESE
jgi:translation initiation factor IF-3